MKNSIRFRAAAAALGIGAATLLVGCAPHIVARTPAANYVVEAQFRGSAKVQVSGLTDAEVCRNTSVGEFCVSRLSTALSTGLAKLAVDFSGPGEEDFIILFEGVDMGAEPAAVNGRGAAVAAVFTIKWKITIKNGAGKIIAASAETSLSTPMTAAGGADGPFLELENAIIERAAIILKAAVEKTGGTDAE